MRLIKIEKQNRQPRLPQKQPKSGSKAMLPSPRPLRTGLVTFTTSGSSLSNAHCGGRGPVTYKCYRACPVRRCNIMHVTEVTQVRASRRSGFKFSTNSCSLHHHQRVPGRKTTRKSAPLPAAVMSSAGPADSTAIPPITGGPSLAPQSFTRLATAVLAGSFPRFATREATGEDGLTTFRVEHRGVKVASLRRQPA